MSIPQSNINIESSKTLLLPSEIYKEMPLTEKVNNFVEKSRDEVRAIISGRDKRMLYIVGPCSIHNIEEAKTYAANLFNIAQKVKDRILVVMRVYFEKPRTTVGWKGLINDPDLDGSFNVNKGLRMARELLLYINELGLPCGCEFLDTITPQYISDLITWGAIGARTVESQTHRQLVSGLSMPIGFKNATSGNIQVAKEAILSASMPHCFMGITESAQPAIFTTKGNNDTHIILRGGNDGPNYYEHIVKSIEKERVMIDCSHGNSMKNYKNQNNVFKEVIRQRFENENENENIIGLMIESNINEDKQNLNANLKDLKYGVSITDSCINMKETIALLEYAYKYNI
jgi:3-deoxy-7-phosphoheptulonate synthase